MNTILDSKVISIAQDTVVDLTPILELQGTTPQSSYQTPTSTSYKNLTDTTKSLSDKQVTNNSLTSEVIRELTASKLNTGILKVTTEITSTNWNPGVSGFYISGDGNVEFNNGLFRGELSAGQIHIPNKTTANSFHTDTDGNSWWGCIPSDFLANNNNATAYILKNGNARFAGTLNVVGTTRLSNTLTLGSTALQKSGKLVMEYYPSDGDTYIRAGKTDFGDNTSGFIIGIDQSDSGQVKAEFGDTTNYVKILPTGIFIRSNNADLTGNSTIAGKLTTVLIAQTDTKEELILRPIDGIEEEEIIRADGTIIDIVQSMPSSGTPVYVTDFVLYGKTLTKDVFFEFDYSMSTSETSHQVKLQCDYNVVHNSGNVKPAAFTASSSQEFTVLNSADYREVIDSGTGTLKIDHTYFTNNNDLVQIRLSRINTGLSGVNHGGSFRIHRVRMYMA